MTVKLKGQKILTAYIKKMSNPDKVFDPDFKKVSRKGIRELVQETPSQTGNARRGWVNPKKIGLSKYIISNDIKTADKKHLLINILDKGRGEVRPRKAKSLYIPLTEKGRSKRLGGKISDDLELGVDYVFAKKSKAVKALNFISKEEKRAGKELTKLMINRIRVL